MLKTKVKEGKEYTKQERRSIQPGSFITFNYRNPVGKDQPKKLRFYDENPCDVILDLRGNDMLCINFHFIERVFRKSVIAFILKINAQRIKQDKRLELTYQEMKEYLHRNGLTHCIKRYKVNRITNLKYVKGTEIKHIVELPSEKFIVQDPDMTEEDLYKLIRSHAAQTKKAKNTRFGNKVPK